MIEYFTEGVEMPDIDCDRIESWVTRVAESHGCEVGKLTYCFCDDEYILKANREFVNHDYYTDIITFDYSRGNRIGGDILISVDTVRSNAEQMDIPYSRELLRVIIHGVLHLVGIDDKGPGEREIMESEENRALSVYDINEI